MIAILSAHSPVLSAGNLTPIITMAKAEQTARAPVAGCQWNLLFALYFSVLRERPSARHC